MDFSGLQTKVADFLNRNDLGAVIPVFIQIAQRRIENDYNFESMKTINTEVSSSHLITVPSRYKEAIYLHATDSNARRWPLTKDSPDHAFALYPSVTNDIGLPKLFARLTDQTKFLIRPTPDVSYTFELYYYRLSIELSAGGDTNWLTNNWWEVLMYGACLEASYYLRDKTLFEYLTNPRPDEPLGLYGGGIARIKKTELSEAFSGPQKLTADFVV